MSTTRTARATEKAVNPDLAAKALAKAVFDGDIVNFRLIFQPFSPARTDSTERFEAAKYEYLQPEPGQEQDRRFQDLVARVRQPELWAFIQEELKARRPAQLPANLILELADNAVAQGKYSSAAQAYELLRIRPRMQTVFYEEADTALDRGEAAKAVRGYLIATGLDYDYSAYPEPLPAVPDFQTRALMLHGEYPNRLEDSLPLREPNVLLRTAIEYLLCDAEAAGRLDNRPFEVRLAFLRELVLQRDPNWAAFTQRFREAAALAKAYGERLQRSREEMQSASGSLAEEIEAQRGADPLAIPAALLGRSIEDGAWWQYLKELAYLHPAAILFVSRQILREDEIIVPRYRGDSPIAKALNIAAD